ncbi:MAG: L-lactate permease [Sporomusaceae bacterium]|nr:L-lactate permease [Sporomusaceae bacterium]
MWQIVQHPLGIGLSALVAFIPLLWLLLSLGVWKMPAHKTCFIAMVLSMALAALAWQMPVSLVITGALDGAVLAIWPILWVIFAAIFTYNMTLQTGAMDKIKGVMASFSSDRRVQALLIAWGFGAFLEAAAGFGTAVAIPAAILISLGFHPFFASVICLIANTVPVAFGAVGIPVITLAKVADLDVLRLTLDCAIQLTPFVIVIPLALIWIMTKSVSGFKGVTGMAIAAGFAFAVPQLIIAAYMGPELTSIVGSVCSMAVIVLWNKISPPAEDWRFPDEANTAQKKVVFETTFKEQCIAWSPYVLLFVFILGTNNAVWPAVSKMLGTIQSSVQIYYGPGGKPMSIAWILTPGTLILLGALIGGLLQGASGSDLGAVFKKTCVQLQKTTITVVSIVALAKVMGYAGMVSDIAFALAQTTGSFYPFIAPIIGALGTFVTGSDTNANVLFGALQKQTAIQIGADPTWITASNTSGATAGKMISPQSIAIATSATGQVGIEGDILRATAGYCLLYTLLLGAWVYFVNATHLFL